MKISINNFHKTIVGTAFVLLILNGCGNDFLSVTPQGDVSSKNFWKTKSDAIAAENSLYAKLFSDDDMFGRGTMWYINASDDMVTGRSNGVARRIKNFKPEGNEGYVQNFYKKGYEITSYSNNILVHLPDMDLESSLKDRIMGEAYFMRGFFQFYLGYLYGNKEMGVPIVTVDNMNEEDIPRADNVSANYAQAASDFKKARNLLPYFTKYADEDLGRAHKDAANAYLAKTYLYWAQYDDSKWSDAVDAANKVINSPTDRHLINTGHPEKDFKSVFSVKNNYSSEYIFSVVSGQKTGSILPGVMLENIGWGIYNGWGYYQPTLSLYNHFEKGDYRRPATILEFGDKFMFNGKSRRYYSNNSRTGFQFNKYMQPFEDKLTVHANPNGNKPTTDLNVPLIRFAEVLLIKSEALIMQDKNGDHGINLIRKRAGLAPISNATMKDLKSERRSELAGEFANRNRDLIRWGDADSVYSKPLYGRNYANKTDPDSDYKIYKVWEARDNFDPDINNVWPIPTRWVRASGIKQNNGY